MNTKLIPVAARNGSKRLPIALAFAAAVMLLGQDAIAQSSVNLGTASRFGVLAGSAITDQGGSTILNGDIGLYPTTGAAITGLTAGQVPNGTIYTAESAGAFLSGAQDDLTSAFNDAAGQAPDIIFAPVYDLGGQTLASGVYNDPSSFAVTGTLTLDAGGNPNAVWIFQAGSTLITAAGSEISLINGADACNVFWQVGSSATIGTDSDFKGNILAFTSITLNNGATIAGSALARNGAVTMDNNTITVCVVPEPEITALLGGGLAAFFVFRRRSSSGHA